MGVHLRVDDGWSADEAEASRCKKTRFGNTPAKGELFDWILVGDPPLNHLCTARLPTYTSALLPLFGQLIPSTLQDRFERTT
jgi:hypothetical protein